MKFTNTVAAGVVERGRREQGVGERKSAFWEE